MGASKVSRERGTWKPKTEIVIDFRGAEPVSKGSMKAFIPRGGKFPVITDSHASELRVFERDIRLIATREMDRRALPCATHQPFELHAVFYLPRAAGHFTVANALKPTAPATPWGKPDWDKLSRAAGDAMTGIVYDDDCRIVRAVIEKRFATADRDVGMWIRLRVLPGSIAEVAAAAQLTL